MAQDVLARASPKVAVPAVDAGDSLLALIPKDLVRAVGEGRPDQEGRVLSAEVVLLVVGERRDAFAKEISSALSQRPSADARTPSDEVDAGERFLASWRILAADARRPAGPGGGDPGAIGALLARLGRAVSRATTVGGDELVHKALERPTDVGALVEFLRLAVPLLTAEREIDPKLAGNLGSLDAEDELVRKAGGLKDAKWVAEYLSIAPKSVAAKARRNELLAIPRGDRNLYPAFQFGDGRVIPGIREILEVLPLTNGWSRMSFLLTPDPGLDGLSPMEAFVADPDATFALAAGAGTQGAA